MFTCINKNSIEYQSLKNRAGIPEFMLDSICRSFLDKYDRFPHLDELPDSNSEQHLRDSLLVKLNDGAKISKILEVTGTNSIEEATISINDLYRDLETTILPIEEEAIVDIVHRPTDNNFDDWTEEDEILASAPRDKNGNLLAPNGKISNLTEKQYVLVRTKNFINWFGDWETNAKIRVKLGKELQPNSKYGQQGETDVVKYEVLNENNKVIGDVQLEFRKNRKSVVLHPNLEVGKGYGQELYQYIANTFNTIVEESFGEIPKSEAAKKMWNSMQQKGVAKSELADEDLYLRRVYPNNASKVVDENGEPLVVYHSTSKQDFGFTKIDFNKSYDRQTFFATDNKYMSQSYTSAYEIINGDEEINYSITRALDINLNKSDSILPTINEYGSISNHKYKLLENIPVEIPTSLSTDELIIALDAAIDNRQQFLLEAEEVKYFKPDDFEISNIKYADPFDVKSDKEIEEILINRHNDKIEGAKREISEFEDAKRIIKLFNIRIESNFRNSPDFPIYSLFMNLRNPLIYEKEYVQRWSDIKFEGESINTRQLANIAKERGYDGVIIKKINDFGINSDYDDVSLYKHTNNPLSGTIVVALKDPNQVKSAISNTGEFSKINKNIYDTVPNSYLILNDALSRLASLYGITFNEISDAELNTDLWKNIIPDVDSVNAFVYNGQIYINTDKADIDAPIHEMFHILVGSMRFDNPTLYESLINSVENLSNYQALAYNYLGRTKNDVNEEIFITELSRYFSGLPSQLSNLDDKSIYELTYNIKRTLDTILMGHDSVKTISDDRLYNMSLKDVIEEVNSSIATSKFNGYINVEGSELHRKLNNIKSDLLKNKSLEQYCE